MAFDPDAYLASEPAFDPDSYLAEQTTAIETPDGSAVEATIESPSFMSRASNMATGIKKAFTGEDKFTPEIEGMPEVGDAPEMNQMSVPAFKASFGLLSSGDTKSLKGVMSQQFGDKVNFTEDSKGNVIAKLPSGSYLLNKPGFTPADAARFAFDALAFTPAGRAASIPRAAGASALTEGAIEAAESSVGGEFNPEDIALATGLGAGGKALENVASSVMRGASGSIDNQLVRSGDEFGVPIMTSDVLAPETFAGKVAQQTGEKIPVAGTGQKRAVQQEARVQALDEIAEKYGNVSYKSIVDSLKAKKDKIKSAAGSVLENTGNKLDASGSIPVDKTRGAILAARTELMKPGVIKSERAAAELDSLINTIDEAPQTFTSLKENRTAFRDIVNGIETEQRSQLPGRAKSLLSSVQKGMTSDMDSAAKKGLSPSEFMKWKKANAVYADEAKKLTKTKLKGVLDKGDLKPEVVEGMLFSKSPSEVRSLYSSLGDAGRKNARSAIISKVVNDLSRRQSGLTPNSFASEMKKQGLQVDTFFKGEEKKQLEGFIDLLNSTRRAQDANIATPTGQSLMGAGVGYAAFTDILGTGATLGSIGGLSRLYESPSVRNALLRIASVPKGSARHEKAVSEAIEILTLNAQAERERQSEK